MDEKVFKEALSTSNLDLLKTIPKADLHNHAGLGMRFSTYNKWCGGGVTPPPKKMNGIAGLEQYIKTETAKYVDSRKGFEFMINATIQAGIEDGITIIEPSIDIANELYYDNRNDFYNYVKSLIDIYSPNIIFRPCLGVHRGLPIEIWETAVIPCIDNGPFLSLDLYGPEDVNNLDIYSNYFNYAKEKNLKIKVHVGEFCEVSQLIETIEVLAPHELQHGISSVTSSYAIDMIKERNIRLNICPSSNVKLGAVSYIEKHPIKELFHAGINVTVNTDDLLLFNSSVSEEFLYLYNSEVLGIDELNEIRLNGLK